VIETQTIEATYTRTVDGILYNGAFAVDGGTLTVDEGASPYVTGSLSLPRPGPAAYEALDPAADSIITLVITRGEPGRTGTTKRFERLYVIDRDTSYLGDTVTLTLAGTEASFNDYKPVTTIDLNRWQGSVRSIVLRTLEAAGIWDVPRGNLVDRALPTYFELRNLFPQSSFETPLHEDWRESAASAAVVRGYNRGGRSSLRIRPTGLLFDLGLSALDSYAAFPLNLTPGQRYRVSGYITVPFRQGTTNAVNARRIAIAAKIGDTPQRIIFRSDQAPAVATTPTRVSVDFTVPAGAEDVEVRLYNGGARDQGDVFWDALTAFEGDGLDLALGVDQFGRGLPVDHFDGDTTDTATYAYVWDGARDQSTPRRLPRTTRPPQTLIWEAGTSAHAFLTPILEAVGARLLWDVDGRAYLYTSAYLSPARANLDYVANLFDATDRTAREATHPDGSPLWADAVSIRYRWLDNDGVQQERTDTAAPTGYRKLYFLELNETPYPGAGQAAYLLARFRSRAQQRSLVGRIDWTLAPAQLLNGNVAAGDPLVGVVDSVSWDLDQDVMTVTTKALIIPPSTRWDQVPAGRSWSAEPVGATWAQDIT